MLILAVEDDEVHQYTLKRVLQAQGFDVITERTGVAAIAAAKEHLPALVLVDVCLPDIIGFEVCRQIKKAPETLRIPVVIYSSTDPGSMEAHDSGADAFLTYPVHPHDLKNVVSGILAKASAASEPI